MSKQEIDARLAELARFDRNAAVLLALRKAGHINGSNCPHCSAKREAK